MKLDVVVTCLKRDLPLLSLAYKNMQQFVPIKQLYVITPRRNFSLFKNNLGTEVVLIDEDCMIEGVTLEKLKVIPLAQFSQGPGWYFQQLLKYEFAFQNREDDHYLIWDADTIPLRPLSFFDDQGRMLLTKGSGYHVPYFQTYKKILGETPHCEFSFIAQHMIIRKSILRKILAGIESHCQGRENWAWKIMRNLDGKGSNRFSEYETYGHYVKEHHPEIIAFRDIPWLHHGASQAGRFPTEKILALLGEKYFFASFEESERLYRRTGRKVRSWLRNLKLIRS